MDLPIKVELQRLSRIHALQLLLPLIPGTVSVVALVLSNSPTPHQLWSIDLGYKTKLAVAVCLDYTIGLSIMAIADVANSYLNAALRKIFGSLVLDLDDWIGAYWRQVATLYLGDELSPARTLTEEELEDFGRIVRISSGNKSITPSPSPNVDDMKNALRKAIELAERANKPDSVAKLTESEARMIAAAEDVKKANAQVYKHAIEMRWNSLKQSLDLLPNKPESKYSAFLSLSSALQATALSAVCLMLQYHRAVGPSGIPVLYFPPRCYYVRTTAGTQV
jgi:hypothetical protein